MRLGSRIALEMECAVDTAMGITLLSLMASSFNLGEISALPRYSIEYYFDL